MSVKLVSVKLSDLGEGATFEQLFRKFKKKVLNEDIIKECRKKEYFMSAREKKEEKHKENVRRQKLALRKLQQASTSIKYGNY